MDLQALITEVKAYCERTGTSVSEFGERVANDRSLVRRIETAGDCRLSTVERIRAFMDNHPNGPVRAPAPDVGLPTSETHQRGAA